MDNINLNSAEIESPSVTYSTGYERKLRTTQIMKLFENELGDLFWIEKALTKVMQKMIDNTHNTELRKAISSHLTDTENQVMRIEQIFEDIHKTPVTHKCDAMEGLIKEAEVIMKECDEGSMRDAGIISAAQKVEHYEIATYGTLRHMAETLELNRSVELLQKTLDEEKAADDKLTEIAVRLISKQNIESN